MQTRSWDCNNATEGEMEFKNIFKSGEQWTDTLEKLSRAQVWDMGVQKQSKCAVIFNTASCAKVLDVWV